MENNGNERGLKQKQRLHKQQQAKRKTFTSDKIVYIAVIFIIALISGLIFTVVNAVPKIVSKTFMENIDIKAVSVDPFEALLNSIGGPEELNENNAAELIKSIEETAKEIEVSEKSLIAKLPEDVRNMQFANDEERAVFYSDLLSDFKGRSENAGNSQEFFEDLGTIQFLTFLYNSENYINKIRQMLAESK